MGNRKKLEKLKPITELTEDEWVWELEHVDAQLTHFSTSLISLKSCSASAMKARPHSLLSIKPRYSGTFLEIACKRQCLWAWAGFATLHPT